VEEAPGEEAYSYVALGNRRGKKVSWCWGLGVAGSCLALV
jgi:hypothetical protein